MFFLNNVKKANKYDLMYLFWNIFALLGICFNTPNGVNALCL